MDKIIRPNKNLFLEFSKDLKEICKPLEKLDITFFNYVKMYPDGSKIDLCTQVEFLDYFYFKSQAYENHTVESNYGGLSNGMMFWSTFADDESVKILRSDFNADHGISLIEKSKGYCEIYHFASSPDNEKIVNFYINSFDVLKLFILYFKENTIDLIRQAETKKIKITGNGNLSPSGSDSTNWLRNIFLDLNIKRFYLSHTSSDAYLTRREMECLSWYVLGKTIDEVAIILNIKPTTVKSFIESIKQKMNCYSKVQLLMKMQELGLTSLLKIL